MALGPVCGGCGHRVFELQEFEPVRSEFKLFAVQCSKCGVAIGVVEYFNSAALIKKLAKALKINL